MGKVKFVAKVAETLRLNHLGEGFWDKIYSDPKVTQIISKVYELGFEPKSAVIAVEAYLFGSHKIGDTKH